MPESAYDCVVIGSGPGGYVAAIRAAQLGMKTAVVEKNRVGGRCLNYACIPAKAVLRVADVLSEVRDANEFGIKVTEPEIDYAAVSARREKVIKTLTGGVSGLFKKNGIKLIEGEGSLAGNGAVSVGGHQLSAKTILLATGSVKKPIPGTAFGGRVIGTEEAWALPELPKTMAVVGAGASGAEIASAYARLGVEVLLFEMLDRVLPTEDADISKVAERGLKRQGIDDPHEHAGAERAVERLERHVRVRRTVGRSRLAGDRGRSRRRHRGARARRSRREGRPERADRCRRGDAHERSGRVCDWRSGARALALAHKASDQGVIAVEDAAGHRDTHPLEYADIPARDVTLHAERRRASASPRSGARGRGRDVVDRQAPDAARSAPAPSTATARTARPSSSSPIVTFR